MQDQLTGNTGSLQQQQGNLQQNSPNLQQSGTPTTTSNTSSILSEAAPQGSLQVTTSTSTTPATIQPGVVHHGVNLWPLLLLLPVLFLVAILFPKKVQAPGEMVVEPSETPVVPTTFAPGTKKPDPKPKKKTKKRKKSARR